MLNAQISPYRNFNSIEKFTLSIELKSKINNFLLLKQIVCSREGFSNKFFDRFFLSEQESPDFTIKLEKKADDNTKLFSLILKKDVIILEDYDYRKWYFTFKVCLMILKDFEEIFSDELITKISARYVDIFNISNWHSFENKMLLKKNKYLPNILDEVTFFDTQTSYLDLLYINCAKIFAKIFIGASLSIDDVEKDDSSIKFLIDTKCDAILYNRECLFKDLLSSYKKISFYSVGNSLHNKLKDIFCEIISNDLLKRVNPSIGEDNVRF